jgi:hypothetical protein
MSDESFSLAELMVDEWVQEIMPDAPIYHLPSSETLAKIRLEANSFRASISDCIW